MTGGLSKIYVGGIQEGKRRSEQEIERLKAELEEYKRQGGIVNLERSWKTKYRQGFEEANFRLVQLGEEPVRIRKVGTWTLEEVNEELSEQTGLDLWGIWAAKQKQDGEESE